MEPAAAISASTNFYHSPFQHGRDNHTAYRRNSCRAGAGNCREEHTYNNGYDCQTTLDSAEEYVRQIQQSFGNAAAAHQFTCEDEEGNRHGREGVAACYHVLCDKAECQLFCVRM